MDKKIVIVFILAIFVIGSLATSCSQPVWVLHLEGAISEEMSDVTFEEGARPNCHGSSWRDDHNRVWEGIPLWLLVGRVDDDRKHKIGAFDDELLKSIQVKVLPILDGGFGRDGCNAQPPFK